MWEIVGIWAGVGLGMGAAGNHKQHWAVRALCVIGGGAALIGLVIALLFGGVKNNGYADFLWRVVLAFVLSALVGGVAWLIRSGAAAVPWLKANPGKIAAVVIGAAVAAAAAGWLASEPEAKAAAPVPAPVAQVEKPAAGVDRRSVEVEKAAVVEQQTAAAAGCECAAGAVCVGPKGGRYCLRPDGSKKYVGRGT